MNDQVQLPSAESIVSRYIELRDYVQAENKAHAARMKPYTESMAVLEGAANLLMRQTGQRGISTEAGSAFYVTTTSVTCQDPEAFREWMIRYQAWNFLTNHVAKEAVEAYIDGPGQGHPPPGIKYTPTVAVQFRKA
jgi:hypothetical protein